MAAAAGWLRSGGGRRSTQSFAESAEGLSTVATDGGEGDRGWNVAGVGAGSCRRGTEGLSLAPAAAAAETSSLGVIVRCN